jgi:hypothetical protein
MALVFILDAQQEGYNRRLQQLLKMRQVETRTAVIQYPLPFFKSQLKGFFALFVPLLHFLKRHQSHVNPSIFYTLISTSMPHKKYAGQQLFIGPQEAKAASRCRG